MTNQQQPNNDMYTRGGPQTANPRTNEPRVNHRIRIREVRVIGDDGAQLGIMLTENALQLASNKGLDLVEVQPTVRPPVCKIMDYGKFKYEQKRKAAELRRNATVIETKEVQFRPKIGQHDFDTKVRHLREFLEEGNKARICVQFRGREIVHPEIGFEVLKRVIAGVADIGQAEGTPKQEGKSIFMTLTPKKKNK